MERLILAKLVEWKGSPYRKPLILKGVRQVGKTWVLKEFGRRHYENTAYFNFEDNELKQLFDNTLDVNRLIRNLSLASGQQISPGRTLIIFDEIQDCPKALNSLKYFYEDAPQYHIAAAGSLLGITLSKASSFPVGKVNFMDLEPLSFTEFLLASGDDNLVSYMNSIDSISPIPDIFFNPLYEKLKFYYITGGMPEPVKMWTEEGDPQMVEQVLSDIVNAYERDFAKHSGKSTFPKISLLWNSIPSQLARENKKFLYSVAKEGARAREYEDALQWLVDSGLVKKVYRGKAPRLPLSAYDDLTAFKLYVSDIGILRKLSFLSPSAFNEGNRLFIEFKGALTENYVLESINGAFDAPPRYWSRLNPSHEVDFLIQKDNEVYPVEVKAETNIRSRSLKVFKELYPEEVKLGIRFSLSNLKKDDDLLNIPLFLADHTDKLIKLARMEPVDN